jgi:hypothetical protein
MDMLRVRQTIPEASFIMLFTEKTNVTAGHQHLTPKPVRGSANEMMLSFAMDPDPQPCYEALVRGLAEEKRLCLYQAFLGTKLNFELDGDARYKWALDIFRDIYRLEEHELEDALVEGLVESSKAYAIMKVGTAFKGNCETEEAAEALAAKSDEELDADEEQTQCLLATLRSRTNQRLISIPLHDDEAGSLAFGDPEVHELAGECMDISNARVIAIPEYHP